MIVLFLSSYAMVLHWIDYERLKGCKNKFHLGQILMNFLNCLGMPTFKHLTLKLCPLFDNLVYLVLLLVGWYFAYQVTHAFHQQSKFFMEYDEPITQVTNSILFR